MFKREPLVLVRVIFVCIRKDIYSQDTLIEEDNERMDIIGQNGNDGLHYDEEIEKPNKKIGKGAITPPGD